MWIKNLKEPDDIKLANVCYNVGRRATVLNMIWEGGGGVYGGRVSVTGESEEVRAKQDIKRREWRKQSK